MSVAGRLSRGCPGLVTADGWRYPTGGGFAILSRSVDGSSQQVRHLNLVMLLEVSETTDLEIQSTQENPRERADSWIYTTETVSLPHDITQ